MVAETKPNWTIAGANLARTWLNRLGPLLGLILVIVLSFVAHQVLSWRRAAGERRQQLKWLATGAAVTCEEELVEGGRTRTFLSTKNPYRDAEGRIAGVLGVSVEKDVMV